MCMLDYKPNSFIITNITDTKDTPETTLIMWLVNYHTTFIYCINIHILYTIYMIRILCLICVCIIWYMHCILIVTVERICCYGPPVYNGRYLTYTRPHLYYRYDLRVQTCVYIVYIASLLLLPFTSCLLVLILTLFVCLYVSICSRFLSL